MRFLRFAALLLSLAILAVTLLAVVSRRAEMRNNQESAVTTAAAAAVQAIDAEVERGRAVVDLAGPETDPAELTASFTEAEACISARSGTRCTGSDLIGLDATGRALGVVTAGGAAVAVSDPSTDSVLVVGDEGAAVVLQLPIDSLGTDPARDTTMPAGSSDGVTVMAAVSSGGTTEPGTATVTADDGEITATVPGRALDEGRVEVTATASDEIGLLADAPLRYGVWLVVGTVLLGLAGWTIVAERRALERRATTDALTGLANRREFERLTEEMLLASERLGHSLSVMLIDLNGFKEINDSLGHQAGDDALRACGERLVGAVRDTDVVARWGGDEFVILLPGLADRSAVNDRAEIIGAALSETPVVGDLRVSGSIGAAIFPRHGHDFESLMRAADLAMYGAKTTGVVYRVADVVPSDLDGAFDTGDTTESSTSPLGN